MRPLKSVSKKTKQELVRARPNWNQYFMQIAQVAASRSTCLRRNVGAILVRDKTVLATGYNGAPSGLSHCAEVGCLRNEYKVPSGERHELCRALHAEQNTITQAACHGVSVEGADIYTTHLPCSLCLKMLLNIKIGTIYYLQGYPDQLAEQMIKDTGIRVEKLGQ